MQEELIINGVSVDLPDNGSGIAIAIVSNFVNQDTTLVVVGDDVGSFSYTIQLPKTRNNQRFFARVDSFFIEGTPDANQFNRNKYNTAEYKVNGISIFSAVAKYLSSDKTYNIQLSRINKSWATLLDFPIQNIDLGLICCTNSAWYTNTIAKPVLVDYGQLRVAELSLLFPTIEEIPLATNVLEIVLAMFALAKVPLNLTNSTRLLFQSYYLFFNNESYVSTLEGAQTDFDMGTFTTVVNNVPQNTNNCNMVLVASSIIAKDWESPVRFNISNVQHCNYSFGPDCSITDTFYFFGQFCANGFNGVYNFNFSGGAYFVPDVVPLAIVYAIRMYVNLVLVQTELYDSVNGCVFLNVPILENDFVEFRWYVVTTPTVTSVQTTQMPIATILPFTCEVSRNAIQNSLVAEGLEYSIGRNLPNDLTAFDFLSYLIKTFNLRYNFKNDILYISQYVEFYEPIEFAANVEDLSPRIKMPLKDSELKEFLNQTYAKTISFAWKNDGDWFSTIPKPYVWTNKSEIVDTKDTFESDFCSYYRNFGASEQERFAVRIWEANYIGTPPANTITINYETGLRIGKLEGSLDINIDAAVPYVQTVFYFETQLTWLQMWTTFFKSFFNKIDTQFQITVDWEILVSDMVNIDFSKLVSIMGRYFYLSETTWIPSDNKVSQSKFVSAESGTFCQLPIITLQPLSQIVFFGDTLELTVNLTAGYTYQWQLNGVNLSNGGNVSGATTNDLVIENLQTSGNYQCVITNDCGSVVSNVATITINIP